MGRKYRVLLGYDGSAYADAAIAELGSAGLPQDVELEICTVSDVWQHPEIVEKIGAVSQNPSSMDLEIIGSVYTKVNAEGLSIAESGAAAAKLAHPRWDVTARALVGSPACELISKSDELESDLVVVGSNGRSAIERVFLGSVSQKILAESRCSVRVARRRAHSSGHGLRVMLAFDGSDFAVRAAFAVAAREWPDGTVFRIVTADDDVFSRPEVSLIDRVPAGKKDTPAAKEWIARVLEKPAAIFREAGLDFTQTVRWGEARGVLLNEAEDWAADSIFVGARGMGRFKRFLIGSVSSALAARARCSVEVVR